MRFATKSFLGALACAGLIGSVQATELVGLAPFTGAAFGQQSDASGPPVVQSFVAPAGAVLQAIRWWGFHGPNSLGPSSDNFVVLLDGVSQVGSLSVSTTANFDEYTLDIADALLTATTLSIFNDSSDVEWFWQSSSAIGNPNAPDATNVAYSLIGTFEANNVAEPAIPGLVIAAFMALTMLRRREKAGIAPRGSTFSAAPDRTLDGSC